MDARRSHLLGQLNNAIQAYKKEFASQKKAAAPTIDKLSECVTELITLMTELNGIQKIPPQVKEIFIHHRNDINTILNIMLDKKLFTKSVSDTADLYKKIFLGQILEILWQLKDKEAIKKMIENISPEKVNEAIDSSVRGAKLKDDLKSLVLDVLITPSVKSELEAITKKANEEKKHDDLMLISMLDDSIAFSYVPSSEHKQASKGLEKEKQSSLIQKYVRANDKARIEVFITFLGLDSSVDICISHQDIQTKRVLAKHLLNKYNQNLNPNQLAHLFEIDQTTARQLLVDHPSLIGVLCQADSLSDTAQKFIFRQLKSEHHARYIPLVPLLLKLNHVKKDKEVKEDKQKDRENVKKLSARIERLRNLETLDDFSDEKDKDDDDEEIDDFFEVIVDKLSFDQIKSALNGLIEYKPIHEEDKANHANKVEEFIENVVDRLIFENKKSPGMMDRFLQEALLPINPLDLPVHLKDVYLKALYEILTDKTSQLSFKDRDSIIQKIVLLIRERHYTSAQNAINLNHPYIQKFGLGCYLKYKVFNTICLSENEESKRERAASDFVKQSDSQELFNISCIYLDKAQEIIKMIRESKNPNQNLRRSYQSLYNIGRLLVILALENHHQIRFGDGGEKRIVDFLLKKPVFYTESAPLSLQKRILKAIFGNAAILKIYFQKEELGALLTQGLEVVQTSPADYKQMIKDDPSGQLVQFIPAYFEVTDYFDSPVIIEKYKEDPAFRRVCHKGIIDLIKIYADIIYRPSIVKDQEEKKQSPKVEENTALRAKSVAFFHLMSIVSERKQMRSGEGFVYTTLYKAFVGTVFDENDHDLLAFWKKNIESGDDKNLCIDLFRSKLSSLLIQLDDPQHIRTKQIITDFFYLNGASIADATKPIHALIVSTYRHKIKQNKKKQDKIQRRLNASGIDEKLRKKLEKELKGLTFFNERFLIVVNALQPFRDGFVLENELKTNAEPKLKEAIKKKTEWDDWKNGHIIRWGLLHFFGFFIGWGWAWGYKVNLAEAQNEVDAIKATQDDLTMYINEISNPAVLESRLSEANQVLQKNLVKKQAWDQWKKDPRIIVWGLAHFLGLFIGWGWGWGYKVDLANAQQTVNDIHERRKNCVTSTSDTTAVVNVRLHDEQIKGQRHELGDPSEFADVKRSAQDHQIEIKTAAVVEDSKEFKEAEPITPDELELEADIEEPSEEDVAEIKKEEKTRFRQMIKLTRKVLSRAVPQAVSSAASGLFTKPANLQQTPEQVPTEDEFKRPTPSRSPSRDKNDG